MSKYKKILVVCDGDVSTGGPEALHHLVSEMRNLGYAAFICYFPFDKRFETPNPYKDFNLEVHPWADEDGSLIIFPEVMPMLALKVKKATAAIWWLSLDGFLLKDRTRNIFREKLRFLMRAIKRQRPLLGARGLNRLVHLSQSYYVSEYLKKKGLNVEPLFEPINKVFLSGAGDSESWERTNEILYNPRKGFEHTSKLIEAFPGYKFTPLNGFTRDQLVWKFSTAKIYIDLGAHPGRDRMPREAAIHGCCVITSQFGSAGNSIDVPIPFSYKLDVNSSFFIQDFGMLTLDIFKDFRSHYHAFASFRQAILSEPGKFIGQIKKYWGQ